MRSVLVTPPTTEPLTLAEAKLHLRVDITNDDDLITTLIAAARQATENYVGLCFLSQTWDLFLDCFPYPCGPIRFPRVPVASLTSATYIDSNGNTQTLSSSLYQLSTGTPARLVPAVNTFWPITQYQRIDAVSLRYVAGVADTSSLRNVEAIKAAMKLMIGALYENRESVVTGTIATKLPDLAETLLDSVEWGGYR